MKKTIFLSLLLVTLFGLPSVSQSITVKDGNYNIQLRIDSDIVKNNNYKIIGRIDGNIIKDGNYTIICRIDGNTIKDGNFNIVGRIDGSPRSQQKIAILYFIVL